MINLTYFAGLCPSTTAPDTLSSQLFIPSVVLSLLVIFGYFIFKGNHGHGVLKIIGILGIIITLLGLVGVVSLVKLLPSC